MLLICRKWYKSEGEKYILVNGQFVRDVVVVVVGAVKLLRLLVKASQGKTRRRN